MIKKILSVTVLLTLIFIVSGSVPLQAGPPEKKLDKAQRAEIVQRVGKLMTDQYVFPDVGKKMAQHLEKQLKKGAYKKITDSAQMAEVLTKDLRSISHDLHIRVRFYTEPPRGRDSEKPDMEAIKRRSAFYNNAFQVIKRLPGNVGYLKFDGFFSAGRSGATAVAAMNFLSNSDALIIDLRENSGGSPSMIQLICSYFFPEPVHLNSFYIRKGDKTQQFWTQAHVQGNRMVDTPLYVLTSKRTFSAAEEFTYNLKNMKRATIVGETTGGGAHPVDFHYIEEIGFGASVPFGRAVNPITKTNWEGKGIKPHVEVPKEEAMKKAYELALKKIVEKGDDERKPWIEQDLNREGYKLMGAGKIEKAIHVFKTNVELFPQSSNAYDSLGEAYMKNDNKELAIKNYKKSLELDPKNKNAVKQMQTLEGKGKEEKK